MDWNWIENQYEGHVFLGVCFCLSHSHGMPGLHYIPVVSVLGRSKKIQHDSNWIDGCCSAMKAVMNEKIKMRLKPFLAIEMKSRAVALENSGYDVIHLELGDPEIQTPLVIKAAAIQAIESGHTHYTDPLGMIDLRKAICNFYQSQYGVSIDHDQVLITAGSTQAILFLLMALLENDDEVIIPNPCYPAYRNLIIGAGGTPVSVVTEPEDGFKLAREKIEQVLTDRTKAILFNSPSNPCGTILSMDDMREIASIKKSYIISDEIYHGLTYDVLPHSILEFTSNAFVVNGFSKTFSMTGWRIGYLIFPKKFLDLIRSIQSNFSISTNSFVQIAAMAAINQGWEEVSRMKTQYNERRKYMIHRLRKMGFIVHKDPEGAFYVFADSRSITSDSQKLADDLLKNARVAVTPGIDFGTQGEGFIRLSFAASFNNIVEGLNRVEGYLRSIGKGIDE